MGKSLYFVRNV